MSTDPVFMKDKVKSELPAIAPSLLHKKSFKLSIISCWREI